MRSFIAIPVAANYHSVLLNRLEKLPGSDSCAYTATKPENLHLTLLFLGDTPAEKLRRLADVLQQRLAGFRAFDLVIEATGGFPGDNSRIVAAHIRYDESLQSLHDSVAAAADSLLLDYDHRRFRPHITLARSKKPLLSVQQPVNMRIPATDCVIYTSRLTQEGPVYCRFATLPFA